MKYFYATMFTLFFAFFSTTHLNAQVLQSIESEGDGQGNCYIGFLVRLIDKPGNVQPNHLFDTCEIVVGLTLNSQYTSYAQMPEFDDGEAAIIFPVYQSYFNSLCNQGDSTIFVSVALYYDCGTDGYFPVDDSETIKEEIGLCCENDPNPDPNPDPQTILPPHTRSTDLIHENIEIHNIHSYEYLQIENISKQSDFAEISIFNMQGMFIKNEKIWLQSHESTKIDYKELYPGAYFAIVQFQNRTAHQKFIKM